MFDKKQLGIGLPLKKDVTKGCLVSVVVTLTACIAVAAYWSEYTHSLSASCANPSNTGRYINIIVIPERFPIRVITSTHRYSLERQSNALRTVGYHIA